MFYSQFILAKKGPLGTIWIAAHLERKLRKNQVADTDIGVSVDSILFPDVPIALRLSSHLLLGVVRIYSRKVNYLFDDCSEALLKVKQAFRSTAVDLPPEESTAPYHSITLPETFDLDDFELPDNDIFQGNFVDHHISTREQITLQDTMDGVVYSTSQFGLDERFGDGDTSQVGLDLEEDLFLDKVDVRGIDKDSEADPQASVISVTEAEPDTSSDRIGSSEAMQVNGTTNKIDYLAANSEFIDFAQAPSTPGLIEEPNLSSIKKGLACDDQLESDDHNATEIGTERAENASSKSDVHQREDATYLTPDNHLNHDMVVCTATEENGCRAGDFEISQANQTGPTNETVGELDDSNKQEVISNDDRCNNEPTMCDVIRLDGGCEKSVEVRLHKTGDEITNSIQELDPNDNAVASFAVCQLEEPDFHGLGNVEAEACEDLGDAENLKHHVEHIQSTSCISALRPCNSFLNPPDATSLGTHDDGFHTELQTKEVVPCSSEVSGRDESFLASETSKKMQGGGCHVTDVVPLENQISEPAVFGEVLEVTDGVPLENQISEPALFGEVLEDAGKQDEKPEDAISNDNHSENFNSSMTSELPAPEKLLSVPQIVVDKAEDILMDATPDKEVLEGSEGSCAEPRTSGKKRSFAESSLTVQSMNSFESSGVTKSKRMMNSVPDDDDLLSSILVGRRSSVLKMKPTPVLEVVSMKRARSASRPSVSKRKVLMDDSMVLLGDTIRQQLTNTEDIRRLRKKAPCTRTEILIIQRQFVEEEIFTESILTGMSAELACLHSETLDLSGIEISKNDGNNASSEAVKDTEFMVEAVATQPTEREESSGTLICGNNVSGEDHYLGPSVTGDTGPIEGTAIVDHKPPAHETLEEVADMEIPSENAQIGESAEQTIFQGEISVDFCMPSGVVVQSGGMDETICGDASLQMDGSNLPSDKMDIDETAFFGNMTHEKFFDVGTSDHCTNDIGAAGSDLRREEILSVESKLDASIEVRTDVKVDCLAPNADPDNCFAKDPPEAGDPVTVHVDQALGDFANEKLVVGNDNGAVALSLECDDKDQMSNLLDNDYSKIGSAYSVALDGNLNKDSLGDGDHLVNQEADQQRTMNEGITSLNHVDVGHSGDFQDAEFANDTEFLNVDDDEVGEEDEDGMPGTEVARVLENSGWSSRTRAVAKYLQRLFDNEAEYGRKELSMDKLLAGKTRKEASRMFFETLVLKSRDYIHVEQEIPFENIRLKPRAKLIKSIF